MRAGDTAGRARPAPQPVPQPVTERVAELARQRGDDPAVVTVAPDGAESELGWRQLDADLRAAAAILHGLGVRAGDLVAVALPKCRQHFAATFGAWHLGARPLTLNPAMPAAERERILDLARPAALVSVGDWTSSEKHSGTVVLEVQPGGDWPADAPAGVVLPDPPPTASFAITTGGSSGVPKIILSPFPGSFVDTAEVPDERLTGRTRDMVQLVNGPLYHNSPCTLAYGGLLWGHRLIVMERFEADLALDLITRHAVSFVPTVPTVMKRMLEAQQRRPRDLGSIRSLFHTGASCPAAVKQGWMDLIGAARVYEAFGGSELIGTTFIRGDEWAAHPGSVGRPAGAEVLILDDGGDPVPPGVVGEIYMRSLRPGPAYRYLGASASASRRDDGFESLGDLGWLSEDGFLHVADRRVDLIITGGENVYPAEVENVLLEHPAVRDAVVLGLADADWGKRVHAIVCTDDDTLTAETLTRACRAQLSSYKVPKSIDVRLGGVLPRDPESGKIRRSALVADIDPAP